MRAGGGAAAAAAGLLGAAAAAAAKLALGPGGEAAGGWVRNGEIRAGKRLPCELTRVLRAASLRVASVMGKKQAGSPRCPSGGCPAPAFGGLCWETGAVSESPAVSHLPRQPGLVAAAGLTNVRC